MGKYLTDQVLMEEFQMRVAPLLVPAEALYIRIEEMIPIGAHLAAELQVFQLKDMIVVLLASTMREKMALARLVLPVVL